MRCPRCLNTDPSYFYQGSKGWYCRRCIGFRRVLLEEEREPIPIEIEQEAERVDLTYPLTAAQKKIATQIQKEMPYTSILVDAVCGAGKTEITVPVVSDYLKQGKKVAFAIARRQVVLELAQRLQVYFPQAKVVPVCQGYTKKLVGDLVVCTTHQLYRYPHTFDLVILDEPDAFPYKGSKVLPGIVQSACRGTILYLTATPDGHLLHLVEKKALLHLTLNRRPHGYPLPVPKKRCGFRGSNFIYLLWWLSHHPTKTMVFCPTIRVGKHLARLLSLFYPTQFICSQTENKDEIISTFRKQSQGILVCTTVMERGITIEQVAVVVWQANHAVFDTASLIQMSGRVGRSFKYPTGDCLFLLEQQKETVDACMEKIRLANG